MSFGIERLNALYASTLDRYDHSVWGFVVRIALVANGSRGDAQPLHDNAALLDDDTLQVCNGADLIVTAP